MKEEIDQAQTVREVQKQHFQEEQRALQAHHDASATEMSKKIELMNEEIHQLKGRFQRSTAHLPPVSTP